MEILETMYSMLIILRIFCVGLAFIAYCKYQNKEECASLLGSIIYTFCGFILYAGIRHPYFTNALILLPLNFIGIEKLLKENKKVFLIFIVFASAVSNYYFFYMITIITILYAFIKYIIEYNHGLKDFFKKVIIAIGCYIVGILMAGAILLPTIYAFLNSARIGYEQTYSYGPNFLIDFFRGIICMRFSNWTVIGVSSIILLMIPVLFTKLKEKESRIYAILLIITTIMLMIPLISSFMNGLSFPSNRWVFAYSFILAYIVTICFNKELRYTRKQISLMLIVLIIYGIIGLYVTKMKIINNLDFFISLAIAGVIWLVILFSTKKLRYGNVIVILLVVCNIGVIAFSLYAKVGKVGKGYASEFKNNNSVMQLNHTLSGKANAFEEAIMYIKEHDNDFYRIAKYDTGHHNISLIYDYHSLQTFLSIGNGGVYNLSAGLEDNHYNTTRCINGMNRRTKITTLLGTKYYICNEKEEQSVPYGYELYHEIGDTKIYKNKYWLSVGNFYDSYLSKEDYEELSPLEKEDALITTAVLENNVAGVRKETDIKNKVSPINSLEYIDEENKIQNNKIEITKDNQKLSLQIKKLTRDTELYLAIKSLQYDSGSKKTDFKITTSFNGMKDNEEVQDPLTSAYYVNNPNFIINLGVITEKSKNELEITFNHKGTYTFDTLEILEVPMESYENKIKKLKKSELTDVEYGNNYLKGYINNEENGILQLTTSYSDGWKAYVDGKKVDILKVNEGFIGIFLEAGEHEIAFQYSTPYLNIGTILSIIGVVIFIIVIILEKRRRK